MSSSDSLGVSHFSWSQILVRWLRDVTTRTFLKVNELLVYGFAWFFLRITCGRHQLSSMTAAHGISCRA